MDKEVNNVLFVCVHNSGRSQMAEAFFNHMVQGKAIAWSAGTYPEGQVTHMVLQAMAEVGIDISQKRPQALTQAILDTAEMVITMGCNVEEVCPANLVPTEDWALEDPKGEPMEKVRQIRDEIKGRVGTLLQELGV